MSYLRTFEKDDILINTLVTYPQFDWVMLSGNIYLNDRRYSGFDIKTGTIDLNEMNVDRGTGLINPYVIKNGNLWKFKSTTTSSYDEDLYGTKLTGAYPYTSSLHREYFFPLNTTLSNAYNSTADDSIPLIPGIAPSNPLSTDRRNFFWALRKRLLALKNTLNEYKTTSPEFKFSGSYATGTVNMMSIPSIAFGTKIEKGSVSLKFYFTGSLVAGGYAGN